MALLSTSSRFFLLTICFAVTIGAWWQPGPKTTWQWQLSALPIDTSYAVEMFDIDLFDAPQATIDLLHSQGKKVICYYSAGSYENWRSDATSFPSSVLGNNLDGWPGERWLDITKISLLAPIMRARLDLAVAKKCDGVEPDNVDGYTQNSGFTITAAQQITYNQWTANEAHIRNLSVGLKNDLDQIPQLVSSYDFAVNEECVTYGECAALTPFITAGKAVFGAMYVDNPSTFCTSSIASGFSFIKKNLNLDSTVTFCLPANFVASSTTTQTTTTTAPRTTTQAVTTTQTTTTQPPTSTQSTTSTSSQTTTTQSTQSTQQTPSPSATSIDSPTTVSQSSTASTDSPTTVTSIPVPSDTTDTTTPTPTPTRTRRHRFASAYALDGTEAFATDSNSKRALSQPVMIAIIVTAGVIAFILIATAIIVYKVVLRRDPLSKNPFRNSRQLQDIDESQLYGTPPASATNSTTTLVNP